MRDPLVAGTGSLKFSAIMMKCHSCSANRKWFKSPRNRFKSASFVITKHEHFNGCRSSSSSSSRSQKAHKIVSPSSPLFLHTNKPQTRKLKLEIIFILKAVIILAIGAHVSSMANSLEASSSPPPQPTSSTSSSSLSPARLSSISQQVAGTSPPSLGAALTTLQSPKSATTRRSATNSTIKTENEDEVDLLRPVHQSSEQVHRASSGRSHIYKIRAAPLNGKLSPPSPSSIRQIQISDALIAHRRVPQVKHRSEADSRTATPIAAPISAASNSQDATTTTTSFGNRAGLPSRALVTSSTSVTAPINTRIRQEQNQAHEHCKQPNEQAGELDQLGGSSIAASSQTLRLTGSNRAVTQLIGSQQQQQPEALSATTTSARSAASSISASRFREPMGEVEELPSRNFEARLKLEAPQVTQRTRPTLIAARASTSTGQSNLVEGQATRSSIGNQLRLAGLSIAETSMATEPFSGAGGSEDVSSNSELRPTGSNSGADSILSLIDDYDSKIITNKTKGKFQEWR